MTFRIFLLDDKLMVREGLKLLLDREPDFEVIGETGDAELALHKIVDVRPDIVIVDLGLLRSSAADLIENLSMTAQDIKILTMGDQESIDFIQHVLACGAAGFISKRMTATELVRAIQTIAEGGTYIDQETNEAILKIHVKDDFKPQIKLSQRELEVLRMSAKGYTDKEIAAQLELSVKTVETYKSRSMEKIGLKTRVDIVRYAILRRWLHT